MIRVSEKLKEYISKQFRFSVANSLSVPIGTFLLYVFTTYGHIWYIYSSLLGLMITTVINFWMNYLFKVIKLK